MGILTAQRTTGTKTWTFLTVYCAFVNPNMWMLNFIDVMGYQGLLFRDFLVFFRFFFFQSDRPTQYQKTHSTLNEKKGGMAQRTLSKQYSEWIYFTHTYVNKVSKSIPPFRGECHCNACRWNFSVQLANSIFDALVIKRRAALVCQT